MVTAANHPGGGALRNFAPWRVSVWLTARVEWLKGWADAEWQPLQPRLWVGSPRARKYSKSIDLAPLGNQIGLAKPLILRRGYRTNSLSSQPLRQLGDSERLASALKDRALRLLRAWSVDAFSLADHYLFISLSQPVQFTHGYLWVTLFLIGAAVMI